MPPISALIITKNEEKNIGRCLQSLQGVADEILVYDSGSTDHTLEIAQSLGARVARTKWKGYAQTKNEGNQLLTHPYVLAIDADEALSTALKKEILAVKDQLKDAYAFPRLTQYCGKWIRHSGWYPDYKIRLFPRETTTWEGDYIHESPKLAPGQTVRNLKGDLLHYSINSLADHLNRVNHYSSLKAQALFEGGKEFHLFHLLLKPPITFLKKYLLQKGYKDGFLGFQLCRISALSTFLKYAKLRELWKQKENA